jgi:hypothetical protein
VPAEFFPLLSPAITFLTEGIVIGFYNFAWDPKNIRTPLTMLYLG